MIGLEREGRPLLRAYSMASANYEDQLEFFSIKWPMALLPHSCKTSASVMNSGQQ